MRQVALLVAVLAVVAVGHSQASGDGDQTARPVASHPAAPAHPTHRRRSSLSLALDACHRQPRLAMNGIDERHCMCKSLYLLSTP